MEKRLLVFALVIFTLGNVFGYIDDIPVHTAPNDQITPYITIGDDQIIYVTWLEVVGDTSRIWFSSSADQGSTFTAPLLVHNCVSEVIMEPLIKVYGSGSTAYVHIAFVRVYLGGVEILYYRSLNAGLSFALTYTLAETNLYPHICLEVDMANYVYLFYSRKPGSSFDVFYLVSTNGGNSFNGPHTVVNTSRQEIMPVIAIEGVGVSATGHVAYNDSSTSNPFDFDIWYCEISNLGSAAPTVGNFQIVTPNPAYEAIDNGGIAVDRRGRVYLAYIRTSSTSFTTTSVETRYLLDYGYFSGPYVIHPSDALCLTPRVDTDWYSNPYIAWVDNSSGDFNVYVRHSKNRGFNYLTGYLVNGNPVSTNQTLMAFDVWAYDCERWLNFVWQGDQTGDFDIYHASLHQYLTTIKPLIAFGGFSASNKMQISYSTWEVEYIDSLVIEEDTLAEWFDGGSEIISSQFATGSTANNRWIINTWGDQYDTVRTCGVPIILYYYMQLHLWGSVNIAPPGLPLDSTNFVTVYGTSTGEYMPVATIWDGHTEDFWVDRISYIYFDSTSSASNDQERWIIEEGADDSFLVFISIPYTVPYWHQIFCDFTLLGTDTEHTVSVLDRAIFGVQDTTEGIWDSWTGWIDYNSRFALTDSTTGDTSRWTARITSWIFTDPIVDTIEYAGTAPADADFIMTGISPDGMQCTWDDFPDERIYYIAEYFDTTIVEGSDSIPSNTIIDSVYGLEENTLYHWFAVGITRRGNRYTLHDSAYTLCSNPTGAAVVDSGADYAVFIVSPFPNDTVANSGYFWDCIEGEAFGGKDTSFFDGRIAWVLDGLVEGQRYTYVVYYMNGDGIMTAVGDTISVWIVGARVCVFGGLYRYWNLFSMSVHAIPPSPVQIFQDDIYPFLLTPINSNLYDYDEPTFRYFVPATMVTGRGYWLYLWHLVRVDVWGRPTSEEFLWDLSYTEDIPIPGWQLLGNPYTNNAIDWLEILADPQTQEVDSTYYAWDAQWQTWAFYAPWFPGGVSNLIPPWRGIEIRAKNGEATLRMTYPTTFPIPRATPPVESQELAEVHWFIQLSTESDWSADRYNYLISATGAKSTVDKYDFFERPPMGETYSCLYFPQYDHRWGETVNFTTYSNDFSKVSGQKDISFIVQTNSMEEITLKWNIDGQLNPGQQVYLEDRITGDLIDMSTQSRYTYRTNSNSIIPPSVKRLLGAQEFAYGEDDNREFRIIVENHVRYLAGKNTELPTSFEILNAYPNPFNSITRIEYSVPSDQGDYSLVIYDILGKEIKVLMEKNSETGFHTAFWNGSDNQGRELPSGIYFCVLQNNVKKQVMKLFLLR